MKGPPHKPAQDIAIYNAYFADDDATHESVGEAFGLTESAVKDALERVRARRAERLKGLVARP